MKQGVYGNGMKRLGNYEKGFQGSREGDNQTSSSSSVTVSILGCDGKTGAQFLFKTLC